MNDTQRIDFLERTGANVIAGTGETLVPEGFSVCVRNVTPWVHGKTLRETIDSCERLVRTQAPALLALRK